MAVSGVSTKHRKILGRFAVNKVTNKLLALGYRACLADFAYDLVAETASGLRRVEVKTGTSQTRPGLYQVGICKGSGSHRYDRIRPYSADEIDFLVAYVQKPGSNAYFVFPPAVFTERTHVALSVDGACKWDEYRSAWHLLGAPVTTPLFTALFG